MKIIDPTRQPVSKHHGTFANVGNGWKADISAEAVRNDANWIFCDVIRQIALGFGVYYDPMSTTNENWEPLEAFIDVLRDFEMISERVEIVIKEHDYPPCADVLFAVARAKEAAGRAATLLRSYVKRPN